MEWAIRLIGMTGFGIGAFAAFAAYRQDRRRPDSARYASLWLAHGVVLATVALQLGTRILSIAVNLIRYEAYSGSWYATRQSYQVAAIFLILVVSFTLFLEALAWLRPVRARYLPAAVALLYNSLFLAITTVSLHQVDALLRHRFLLFHTGQWGYLLGLALTAVSLYAWRKTTAGRRPD